MHAGRAGRIAVSLAVCAIVAVLGVWAQNSSLVGVNYDDGIYVLVAKALAQGEGYRLTWLPVNLPAIKYPPVYPFSLVPFWLLSDSPETALGAMKLANGVYIGLAAGLFVFLLSDLGIVRLPLAGVLALVGFASGSMMLVSSGLLSEPLYLVLLPLALWLIDRLTPQSGHREVAIAAVAAGLVALTRMVGISLLVAMLLAVAFRCGRRRALTAVVASAVLVGPWFVFTLSAAGEIPATLIPNYGSYAQLYLASIAGSPLAALDIVATNVGALLQTLGAKFMTGSALAQSLAGGLLLVIALVGSRKLFRSVPATASYPWLYLAIVCVWSFPPFRFAFVLFPLLLALAAVGYQEMAALLVDGNAKRAGETRVRRGLVQAAPLIGLIVIGYLAFREARALDRRVWDGSQILKSEVGAEVLNWVSTNTDPRDVIAYEFDPLIALHTGRRAVPNNYESVHVWYRRQTPPVEPLARLLRDMGVRYLAVRRDIPAVAEPIDALAGRYPNSLSLIHVTPGGALIFRTHLDALPAEPDASSSEMPK